VIGEIIVDVARKLHYNAGFILGRARPVFFQGQNKLAHIP